MGGDVVKRALIELALIILVVVLTIMFLFGDSVPTFTPLDLPSGGIGLDDEEDSPEIISFYGSQFEGQSFYWCLDKSGSMGARMPILKSELHSAIGQLSDESKFGLVAFSSNVVKFMPIPVVATVARKAQARQWVSALNAAGHTHLADGAIATLELSWQDQRAQKLMIVVGDGLPNPGLPELTIFGITLANYEPIPINTIFLGPAQSSGVEFMEELAAANGGVATQIAD